MIRAVPLAVVLSMVLAGCAPTLPYLGGGPIAAGSTASPPPPATPRERLVTAIEENGCLLTADNAARIQLRANLSRDELTSVIDDLRADHQVEAAAPGTIRLLSQNCI